MERSIFVINDDDQARTALIDRLSTAGYVAQGFANAASLLQFSLSAAPCCLILQIRSSTDEAVNVLKTMKQMGYAIPTIVISETVTTAQVVDAMKAGAYQFFINPVSGNEIVQAVEGALSVATINLASSNAHRALQQRLDMLTPREHDVLKLAVGGLLNKQMASELGISEITVKVHKRRVMEKMGADSLPIW